MVAGQRADHGRRPSPAASPSQFRDRRLSLRPTADGRSPGTLPQRVGLFRAGDHIAVNWFGSALSVHEISDIPRQVPLVDTPERCGVHSLFSSGLNRVLMMLTEVSSPMLREKGR